MAQGCVHAVTGCHRSVTGCSGDGAISMSQQNGHSTWHLRSGRVLLLPALLLFLGGCGAYLHNPGRASATADLKSKAEKLTAPAYFEAQGKNLSDLAEREDLALAELLTASRDYRLLNVIRPPTTSTTKESGAFRLSRHIQMDIKATFGRPYLSQNEVRELTRGNFIRATARNGTSFLRFAVEQTAKDYKIAGGTLPTDCASVIGNPNPPQPDASQADRYARLAQACNDTKDDVAILSDCALNATGSDLATVCSDVVVLEDDAQAMAQRDRLAAAEKALRAALKAAKPSAEASAVTAAEQFIAKAKKLSTAEATKEILTQVEKLLGETLGSALADLNAGAALTASEVSKPLAAALDAVGAAYQYRDATRIQPMETASAVLIGIAKVRHDLNILDIDIAARRTEREIANQQADALRKQLYYLAQAQQALCSGRVACTVTRDRRAFSEALSFYIRSQNVGRGPYEILSFRRLQLKRATALNHATATEKDYRALIQPAIDQLAAYGAKGIKFETIANFFAALPVSGAILAE